jgi:hypothetical protein
VVFCIFDFNMIVDLFYIMTMPDVDLRDKVLPLFVSAYLVKRSISFIALQCLILKLGCAARYSMRWWRAAHCSEPVNAQKRANYDTANEMCDQKSKNQRSYKFAGTAVMGKGKDKSCHAPLYLPVRQELQSDSESEGGYTSIAAVQQRPPLQLDYRALNALCLKDTRKDYWTKAQTVDGVVLRTPALASMCLADDELGG